MEYQHTATVSKTSDDEYIQKIGTFRTEEEMDIWIDEMREQGFRTEVIEHAMGDKLYMITTFEMDVEDYRNNALRWYGDGK